MVGKEGSIDVIGIGGQVGLVGLFQSRCIGCNGAGIAGGPDHIGDLAVHIAEGKVEDAGDAALVVFGDLTEILPDLGHQIAVGLDRSGHFLDPAEDFHILGDTAGVELLGSIQPEAGHTFPDPELHDLPVLFPELFAGKIHIRHGKVEHALVEPFGALHRPGACAGFSGEEVVIQVLALLHIGLGTGGQILQVGNRFLEPGVLGGSVVENQVDDHMDVPLFALSDEGFKIFHGAVGGVDGIVVFHIVFMIGGAGMDGHQPEAPDA